MRLRMSSLDITAQDNTPLAYAIHYLNRGPLAKRKRQAISNAITTAYAAEGALLMGHVETAERLAEEAKSVRLAQALSAQSRIPMPVEEKPQSAGMEDMSDLFG